MDLRICRRKLQLSGVSEHISVCSTEKSMFCKNQSTNSTAFVVSERDSREIAISQQLLLLSDANFR